ncbi:MAG TPA: glycosyltransferase family 39 protein, partial [Actinomycetota bacterium]|nr:glycosyltransferase family 39 protein [Actinomycetota bacterium]
MATPASEQTAGTGPAQLTPLSPGVFLPAAVAFLALVAFSGRYGWHTDELYFLEASKHMAWGYVDQPPFAVAIVWLARHLFGESLSGLRLFPALSDAGTVILAGLIARELGGRRVGQVIAAASVAAGPVFMASSQIANTTPYDLTAWAAITLLIVRIVRTDDQRLWLAVGAVLGLALLNNETVLLLVGGVGVGLLLNGQGRLAWSPWMWAGALLALAIWAPNLVWEARHAWPSVAMSKALRREHSGIGDSIAFVFEQLILPGWPVLLIWIPGLWALWREPRFRPYRWGAIGYAVMFVANDVVIGDRPYYLGGIYALLLAAGACVLEEVLDRRRALFSRRQPRRALLWRSSPAVIGWIVVTAILGSPAVLPVLPANALGKSALLSSGNLGAEVGWLGLVATVGHVYRSVPVAERPSVTIVTEDYGAAGAIALYGSRFGLPPAYSGHNNYWYWGTPAPALGTAILVGFTPSQLPTKAFRSIRQVATFRNAAGVNNGEEGDLIWLATGQTIP